MTTNVLSIDVGIRNLSFCLLNEKQEILKWDIIDLTEKADLTCKEVGCNKPSKYIYTEQECYCLKHAKTKSNKYLMPIKELGDAALKKQKLDGLSGLCKKYFVSFDTGLKKQDMVTLLTNFRNQKCFHEVGKTNASKTDLVTIGENIMHKFDQIFTEDIKINHLIIENQIGPLANKMKTIQGMLVQYFIMRNTTNNINIEFISATNKLKEFSSKKLDYKQRKALGIQVTGELLTNIPAWKTFMTTHTKKDDLCDCYLQGIWFIKNKL